jgi:hypothetical protein
MMTHDIAFELSRQRLALATERAALRTLLGELPTEQALFPFRRRQVVPLAGEVVVVRRQSDKERIRRRLMELSAATPARVERRAS